jgi:hypothetical protein
MVQPLAAAMRHVRTAITTSKRIRLYAIRSRMVVTSERSGRCLERSLGLRAAFADRRSMRALSQVSA